MGGVFSNELYLLFISNLSSWPKIMPRSLSFYGTRWAFSYLALRHYLFIHSHFCRRRPMDQNTISRRCNQNSAVLWQILPHFHNTHRASCQSNLPAPYEYEAVLKSVFLLHAPYRAQLLCLVAIWGPQGVLTTWAEIPPSASTLGLCIFSSLQSEL